MLILSSMARVCLCGWATGKELESCRVGAVCMQPREAESDEFSTKEKSTLV